MTAINFPDSPSNGDTHVVGGVTYTYDSTETKWKTTINSNAFLPLTGGTLSGNIVLASGRLLVGTSTGYLTSTSTVTQPLFQVHDTNANEAQVSINSWATGTNTGGNLTFCRSDSGTVGTHTVVGVADGLGNVRFAGSDGTKFIEGASIAASADGTWGADDGPTKLVFSTTADGASSSTERMRLTSTGDLRFNSGYGSVATAYGCRAWVNFNGTGTVAIRASGNVSSITDNGTGAYTVNFATALVDANYAHEAQGSLTLTDGNLNHEAKTHTAATGSVKVRSSNNAATNSAGDLAEIRVIIFR